MDRIRFVLLLSLLLWVHTVQAQQLTLSEAIAAARTGSVQALGLVLLPSARVHGDISYIALDMRPGASVVGRLLPKPPTATSPVPLMPSAEEAASAA